MKIKDELPIEILLQYGFTKVDKQGEERNDQYTIAAYDYQLYLGFSRRGQYYVLLVNESTRRLMVYATEPDGSGAEVQMPDVLIKMVVDGVLSTN